MAFDTLQEPTNRKQLPPGHLQEVTRALVVKPLFATMSCHDDVQVHYMQLDLHATRSAPETFECHRATSCSPKQRTLQAASQCVMGQLFHYRSGPHVQT
jgi:hypothetical protein